MKLIRKARSITANTNPRIGLKDANTINSKGQIKDIWPMSIKEIKPGVLYRDY